jgi:hypothetical protein
MEHDVVLIRQDGSKRHFRIYGRPTPNVGDILTLPIDGHLIKARVGEIHGVASPRAKMIQSVDHVDAAEMAS